MGAAQVPRGASQLQIKDAYRRLQKRFHPDRSSGEVTRLALTTAIGAIDASRKHKFTHQIKANFDMTAYMARETPLSAIDSQQRAPVAGRRAQSAGLLRAQGDADRSAAINAAFVGLTDRGARAEHDAFLRRSGVPAATIVCVSHPLDSPSKSTSVGTFALNGQALFVCSDFQIRSYVVVCLQKPQAGVS